MKPPFKQQQLLMILLLIAIQIPLYILYTGNQQQVLMAFFLILLIAVTLYFGSVVGLYTSLVFIFVIGSAYLYISVTKAQLRNFELVELNDFFLYGVTLLCFVLLAGRIYEINKEAKDATKSLKDKIAHYVAVDTDSGFDNRARFEKALMEEVKRTNRTNEPFLFLLIEIQNMKKFKDLYGESEERFLVSKLAEKINLIMRTTDRKYRFSPESFALILPSTNADYLELIYEKLKDHLHEHQLLSGNLVTIQLKAGHFLYESNQQVSIEEMLETVKRELMINEI